MKDEHLKLNAKFEILTSSNAQNELLINDLKVNFFNKFWIFYIHLFSGSKSQVQSLTEELKKANLSIADKDVI